MKRFLTPGILFPAANVCNFLQGHDQFATSIAIANLAICIAFACFQDRKLPNALLVTALCVLAIAVILLGSYEEGRQYALFPGLAALFFGAGNLLAYLKLEIGYRANLRDNRIAVSLLHPAAWYGIGYAMTAIAIGGGVELINHPLANKVALGLTIIGIVETLSATCLLVSGAVKNQAIPFKIVACGTLCFALAGVMVGNIAGTATGLLACAGELSLAKIMQKKSDL